MQQGRQAQGAQHVSARPWRGHRQGRARRQCVDWASSIWTAWTPIPAGRMARRPAALEAAIQHMAARSREDREPRPQPRAGRAAGADVENRARVHRTGRDMARIEWQCKEPPPCRARTRAISAAGRRDRGRGTGAAMGVVGASGSRVQIGCHRNPSAAQPGGVLPGIKLASSGRGWRR